MHEYSLIADLIRKIETLAREQHASKVTHVKLRIGALADVSAAHFRDHFAHAARATVAEGARLETERLTDVTDPRAREIVLDSVEIDD